MTAPALRESVQSPAHGRPAWLRHLGIRDFRNLARVDLDPPPTGLALVGDNGQGKTNFLEAIYYLQILRSFRGAREAELVRFGSDGFHLAGAMEGARAAEIAVGLERSGRRKRVKLNGLECSRFSDALGAFPAVIFSPRDVALVAGSPAERRRYLDVMLALTSRTYLTALQRYRGALAQRNATLRLPGISAGDTRLVIWEPELAESGALLWESRGRWIEAHASRYGELCAAVGERGSSSVEHAASRRGGPPPAEAGVQRLRDELLESFERRQPQEVSRGVTLVGPHRDDLLLTLDGRELRTFGSAGQQRTAAIALRLLEAATLRAHAGAEPVVLLDDPFAELDARRSARILELLNGEGRGQTFLAVPRPHDIPPELTRLARWRIEGGALTAAAE